MTQPLRTTALTRPTARLGATVLLAGLLTLTGCGSSDEDSGTPAASSSETSSSSAPSSSAGGSPSAPAETGTTAATASLVDFDIELSGTEMAAGEYEFEVTNDGGASHDLVVERDGEDVAATEVLSPGGGETLAVTLEPGEYVFYCSVGGHRSMGMEITVTVA
ncbi:Plastocyanin [Blastococcus aurantiacus]|uniref:Plastocyanin n=1 Tax=Blastococcus aurantiacus TaxID=1550231 RepID=A0A1G7I688_9ACTN|nr:cupredoxin domain-containing protein [Blastococcus aurantiacus]SDF08148.1 Plastocyanin [Blastococcus aurantiacus]